MGNPMVYYKEALQNLAYYLNCHSDIKVAKQFLEEKNIEILEKYILEKKSELSPKEFFYNAGMASMYTMQETDRYDGCDGFNACVGGISMFDEFIGLEDEEENKKERK